MKGLLAIILINTTLAAAQQSPVTVQSRIETINDSTATIIFDAQIERGWHVYSTNIDGGPISASFNIENIVGCNLIGSLETKGREIIKHDDMFDCEVRYFENNVSFKQSIHILNSSYNISGYLEYGACNDENCLPPTAVNFSFGNTDVANKTFNAPIVNIPNVSIATVNTSESMTGSLWDKAEYQSRDIPNNDFSLWLIFWSCFLGGFIALLTPCVWPIIPMTVSFFLKRSSNRTRGIRDSITYGVSIIIIYLILGLTITYIAGPNALNALSTNAVFNLIFTALLLIFGISFFGAFELTLPSSWSSAVDSKASKTTGLLSIFLMAFTLALVSFSCTGPIIGFLLVQVVTSGNFLAPAIGMFGFALALALPFTIFALFPQWLSRLPRSGSWMNTIKVVLGFIEIAFSLKFLSVADLAYGWHLLDRETFIAIWTALAITLSLYLFGFIHLPHDGENEIKIGIPRLFCAIISFAFAIYLIPGLLGAPLKSVSAFVPPMYTQDFDLVKSTPHAQFTDYEEGMNYAKTTNKPVLIDFTGYGCVNCRKMEQTVHTDSRVAEIINNDFIYIALHTDDKTKLPQHIEVQENNEITILRTVGDKWSYLQRRRFGVNAQPFYVILNTLGELIAQPIAFDENPENFLQFLNEGKTNFK